MTEQAVSFSRWAFGRMRRCKNASSDSPVATRTPL